MCVALVGRHVGFRWAMGLALSVLLMGLSVVESEATARVTSRFGCELGVDFVAFLSSAHLLGSGEFYDLEAQGLAKQEILGSMGLNRQCPTTPMEYLALFVVPLLPLTFLPPLTAFWVWTAINLALVAFALHRLARAASVSRHMLWLWGLGFFPIVWGLALGQVTGLLLLIATEGYLALRNGLERRAGIWLALLLLKPQFLPLLLVLLAWQRRKALLVSFSLSALVVIGLSFALVGVNGGRGWLELIGDVGGAAAIASAPRLMINWRALTTVFFAWLGPGTMLAVIFGLSLSSAVLALLPWRDIQWRRMSPETFDVGMVSVTAVALLIGYSSHLHSLVLLVPPMVFVGAQAIRSSRGLVVGLVDLFAFGPSLLFQAGVLTGIGAAYPIPSLGTVAILCILNVMALGRRRLGLGKEYPSRLSESSKVLS